MFILQRRSTPLHYASFGGHTEVVPILLSNGASTEAKNSVSITQFITHITVVLLLLQRYCTCINYILKDKNNYVMDM